ncbi:MAG: hypothetical protein ACJ8G3_27300 [Burkholderiaceae bacterium]
MIPGSFPALSSGYFVGMLQEPTDDTTLPASWRHCTSARNALLVSGRHTSLTFSADPFALADISVPPNTKRIGSLLSISYWSKK